MGFFPYFDSNPFSPSVLFLQLFSKPFIVMSNNQGLPRHLQDGAHPRREPAQGLMDCEICGSSGKVFESQIDGTTMYACERCAGGNKKTSVHKPFPPQVSFQ
ncbi:MAG: hypothetical protein Q7K34_00920, partial [archaeon]|nr:hypothetical protein [archaeon]